MSVSRTLKTDLYYNNTHKNTIIVVSFRRFTARCASERQDDCYYTPSGIANMSALVAVARQQGRRITDLVSSDRISFFRVIHSAVFAVWPQ